MRKAPLNALENPVYPDIKRGPPRRIHIRPKWTVDADREATEGIIDHPELYAHAILEHDYSESKFKYGRMNPDHTLVVNENFRPPPDDLEDYLPLSRMKVGTVAVRTNPGGGYYKAQNTSLAEVNSYLSDRVKSATSVPTIEVKLSLPIEAPRSLDRQPEDTLPTFSTSSGGKYRGASSHLAVREMELEEKTPRTGASAGYRTRLTPSEDYDRPLSSVASKEVPTYSVSAGRGNVGSAWNHQAYAPVELEDEHLITSGSAGVSTPSLFRGEGYQSVRMTDRSLGPADSGRSYRRRDDLQERDVSHAIVDRPTVAVWAPTTYLKEGFRVLDIDPLEGKLSVGPLDSGRREITESPDYRPRGHDVSHLAAKQTYQVSSGRTAPPTTYQPVAPSAPKRKSSAMTARSTGPARSQPHQGFHTILSSTRS